MKLSAFLICYDNLYKAGATTRQVVDAAVDQGFRAIEPFTAPDLVTVEQAEDLGRYVRDKGAQISCYSMCSDLFAGEKADVLKEMKHRIDMAAAMGAPYFHHTIFPDLRMPRYGDLTFQQALKKAMTILPELCRYAEDKGVLCAYEDQGMYFNGCSNMQRLCAELGDLPYGLVADLGNIFFVDERPESFIGCFSSKIVHVHCKDYRYISGNQAWPGDGWYMTRSGNFLQEVLPGQGDVAYLQIFRLLKQMGYDGWFSLEHEGDVSEAVNALNSFYNAVETVNIKKL